MATTPNYTGTVRKGIAVLSAAETSRTAPSAAVSLLAAGGSGTRVESVRVIATGTTTAGMVRLFVYDGANYRLVKEIDVRAVTPSATVRCFESIILFDEYPESVFLLASGQTLFAATHNAEGFNVFADGGNF